MRAIIVEDIPDVREALKTALQNHLPEIELLGEADSVVSGAKLVREKRPDLLFLDIELPDGTGFDLLDLVDHEMQVIFTTGSEEYALKAFQYAAVHYLLKPVDPEALKAAVERLQVNPQGQERYTVLAESLTESVPSRIALHTSDKIHIVQVADIVRCEADGNYTLFYILGHKPILITRTLKEYDKLLSAAGFVRVHQSHLVQLSQIREVVKTDGTYLIMKDGSKVPISVRKRQAVLESLEE